MIDGQNRRIGKKVNGTSTNISHTILAVTFQAALLARPEGLFGKPFKERV